jgi:asparagine synthetase A
MKKLTIRYTLNELPKEFDLDNFLPKSVNFLITMSLKCPKEPCYY